MKTLTADIWEEPTLMDYRRKVNKRRCDQRVQGELDEHSMTHNYIHAHTYLSRKKLSSSSEGSYKLIYIRDF